jgi:hypothetical protein
VCVCERPLPGACIRTDRRERTERDGRIEIWSLRVCERPLPGACIRTDKRRIGPDSSESKAEERALPPTLPRSDATWHVRGAERSGQTSAVSISFRGLTYFRTLPLQCALR